jgi:O-antigen ligase
LVTLPLVLMGVGEAILGLAQVAGNPGAVASGTYLLGDHYGGFLAMTLPFVALYPFAMLASRDPDRQNEVAPALLVCTGLGLSTLIMTAISYSQSRMSLVASLISMMLVTIAAVGRGRWRRRISLIFGGTALMAILVFVLAPSTRLWMQFGEMEKNEDQALASGEALDLVGTYPVFGCGLGGFQSAFGKFDNSNSGLNHEYADNDYLQYLAELGIAGLLLAAIPLSIILVRLRSAWSQQRWDLRWITLACAGGVVAIAIHSLVNCDLYVPANLLASAWILGIAAHAGRSASLDNSAIEPSAIIVVPPTGVRSKSYR